MVRAHPPAVTPRPGEPDGFTLPRRARIHSGSEIRSVMRRGKRWKTEHLDVFSAPSPSSFPRLGLVVPKHRHRIVDRNLLKRRLREIGRIELLPRLRNAGLELDVLIRTRPGAYAADFHVLRDEIIQWVEEELCAAS